MTARSRSYLRAVFETGDVPQQADYEDLFDSFISLLDTSAQTIAAPLLFAGGIEVSGSAVMTSIVVADAARFRGAIAVSGVATFSDRLTMLGRFEESVDASINAAGTNQGTAKAITKRYNTVIICSAGTNAGLITASARAGLKYTVYNRSTDNANLYPLSGAQIDALGNNNPIVVSASGVRSVTYMTATQAYSGG